MTYVIEKNIPVAPSKWGTAREGKAGKYPLKDMAVGDSFMVAGDEGKMVVRNIYQWSKKLGMKFTYRNIGNGGHRFWRIA